MSKYDFSGNVPQALENALSDPAIAEGNGTLRFVKQEGGVDGRIHLRSGNLFAASSSTYPLRIVARLLRDETVPLEERENLKKMFGHKMSSPESILWVVDNDIIEGTARVEMAKDHTLGVLDDLYTWDHINIEWRPLDDTITLNIPPVPLSKVLPLVKKRAEFRAQRAAEWGNVPESRVFECSVSSTNVELSEHDMTKLSEIEGRFLAGVFQHKSTTIEILANEMGVSPFTGLQNVHALQKAGFVTISTDDIPKERKMDSSLQIAPLQPPQVKQAAHAAPTTVPPVAVSRPTPRPITSQTTEPTPTGSVSIQELTSQLVTAIDLLRTDVTKAQGVVTTARKNVEQAQSALASAETDLKGREDALAHATSTIKNLSV